jgi:small-conductance mechanosensitive channel
MTPIDSKHRRLRRIGALVAGALGLASSAAWAAEPAASDADAVIEFTRMIRWTGVATSLLVMFGAWAVLRFLKTAVDGLSEQFANRRLTLQHFATVAQFAIYLITAVIVVLLSFRIDARTLAVIGGTVAVSVGFAVKDLVASVIAGVMIMIDRPFQVGDRVLFAGEYGDITAIGLRSVRMQTLDDNTVTIPNNRFLSEVTSCGNYGALDMQVAMDYHIGADQDVDLARELVSEAAASSRFIYLPKPIVVLVNPVIIDHYVAVRLRLKAYVLDTKYEKAFETDVNLRVLSAFREFSILPPGVLHSPRA